MNRRNPFIASPALLLLSAFAFFFLLSLLSSPIAMSDAAATPAPVEACQEEATVQIVYVQQPDDEEPEAFHIRTLAAVLGSEEAAKEALIYHYKHAASGFSAKLTPKQVEELSKQPGVLQVIPSRTLKLMGPSTAGSF